MNDTVARKGAKTSEFYGLLLFVAVVLANGTEFVTIPSEHIAMIATLAFGYGGGRTLLKNTLAKKGEEQ